MRFELCGPWQRRVYTVVLKIVPCLQSILRIMTWFLGSIQPRARGKLACLKTQTMSQATQHSAGTVVTHGCLGVFTYQPVVWAVPEDRASSLYYFATSRCWWYSRVALLKLFTDIFGRLMKVMAVFLEKFMLIHTHRIFHRISKRIHWLSSGINIPQL